MLDDPRVGRLQNISDEFKIVLNIVQLRLNCSVLLQMLILILLILTKKLQSSNKLHKHCKLHEARKIEYTSTANNTTWELSNVS